MQFYFSFIFCLQNHVRFGDFASENKWRHFKFSKCTKVCKACAPWGRDTPRPFTPYIISFELSKAQKNLQLCPSTLDNFWPPLTHRHATMMACYTSFERSWHAKCQSMWKWLTPLMAVMQMAKEHNTQLIIQRLRRSPVDRNKWADVRPLVKYSMAQWCAYFWYNSLYITTYFKQKCFQYIITIHVHITYHFFNR